MVGLIDQLKDATYEPGRTYELMTFGDIFALYAWLPDDRAAVFLDEVTTGIRLAAPSIKLVSLVAGFVAATATVEAEPFGWIDDDKGEGTVSFRTEQDGEIVSFNYQRDPSEQEQSQ
jgi:hypothetical protein